MAGAGSEGHRAGKLYRCIMSMRLAALPLMAQHDKQSALLGCFVHTHSGRAPNHVLCELHRPRQDSALSSCQGLWCGAKYVVLTASRKAASSVWPMLVAQCCNNSHITTGTDSTATSNEPDRSKAAAEPEQGVASWGGIMCRLRKLHVGALPE